MLLFFASPKMGEDSLSPLCYFFLCLAKKKVTKKETRPTRTAVLSGRHVDASWREARAVPCAEGLRYGLFRGFASKERALALRSVPPAVY